MPIKTMVVRARIEGSCMFHRERDYPFPDYPVLVFEPEGDGIRARACRYCFDELTRAGRDAWRWHDKQK